MDLDKELTELFIGTTDPDYFTYKEIKDFIQELLDKQKSEKEGE